MGSASCLNNPQDSFIFPQSKKLSLTRKCDKILAKIIPQESVSALVHKSRNEKGGRKYWGRTYRPWSP